MKKIQKEELMNNLKQVDNWCLKNSIPYKEPKKIHLDGSGKNKATEKNISVSGAILVGGGKDDALEKDSLVKMPEGGLSHLTDKEYKKLLKTFKNSPFTGCTTVLDMARKSSGYDPLSLSDDGVNDEKFKDYIKRVLDAPFFHIRGSDSSKYKGESKDWNEVIDFVSDLYDGVTAGEKEAITKSIKSLAKVAASKVDTKQHQSLFVQSTLKADKFVQVYIYSSHVTMETHNEKGGDSTKTDITIKKVSLDFYIDLWPSYAESVMNKHVKTVKDWLDDNTTKEETSKKVNLTCLKDG